jgi:hypothetical protein
MHSRLIQVAQKIVSDFVLPSDATPESILAALTEAVRGKSVHQEVVTTMHQASLTDMAEDDLPPRVILTKTHNSFSTGRRKGNTTDWSNARGVQRSVFDRRFWVKMRSCKTKGYVCTAVSYKLAEGAFMFLVGFSTRTRSFFRKESHGKKSQLCDSAHAPKPVPRSPIFEPAPSPPAPQQSTFTMPTGVYVLPTVFGTPNVVMSFDTFTKYYSAALVVAETQGRKRRREQDDPGRDAKAAKLLMSLS